MKYMLLRLTMYYFSSVVASFTHRIQGGSSPQVWEEAHFEQLKQKALVLNTIHPVQKQHHGGLVIWTEAGRHVRLCHRPVWERFRQERGGTTQRVNHTGVKQ